jgi:hypothetical protein
MAKKFQIDLETFESLVSSARAEYLAKVVTNFGKLDEGALVRKLDNAPIDKWSETQLKGPQRYTCSAIPFLEVDLERVQDKPTLRVAHPDLSWSVAGKAITGPEINGLYARVDAHFAKLRTQEQEPIQFYFGSEVGGD